MRVYKKKPVIHKKKRVVRRRTAPKKSTFSKRVLAVVQRTAEHKVYSAQAVNKLISYYTSGSLSTYTLMPVIAQGTGAGDRIGDSVTVKSAILRGFFNATPYNATTNPTASPIMVRMFVGYKKPDHTTTPVGYLGYLFRTGDSINAPSNQIMDQLQNINKDLFSVVAQRSYKIGLASQGLGLVSGNESNNDFKYLIKFSLNLTRHYGILKFNDANAPVNTPTNKGLWMWFIWSYADGSTSTNVSPVNLNYDLEVSYTDL